MKQYGIVLAKTTELVVTIVAFILIGSWIDEKYNTNQKALIILTVVGSVFAFVRFIVSLQKMNKEDEPK